jgi:hypothetical protein
VLIENLGREAGELLNIAGGSPSRSLNQLVSVVSRQVPGCSGATSAVWREGSPVVRAASHPDLADLFDLQHQAGSAPWLDALASNTTVSCADTLEEGRWPGFAAAALSRGVRCCATLVHRSAATAITLTMFGARPRSLDPEQLPLAELLVAFGGAIVGSASGRDDVQHTVRQLRDAGQARARVDQAKGILMHARGCTAEEALAELHASAQAQDISVTEAAGRVIDSPGAGTR